MTLRLSSIERRLLVDHWGRWLWVLRNKPAHAIHHLAGIVLPPHERTCIRIYFSGYAENDVVCSRGTSKSFIFASLCPPTDIALHKSRDLLIVSASGFRGGKLILEDSKRLILGELRSQRMGQPFLRNSARNHKIIRQEPDRWVIDWSSHSKLTTVPTNNEDTLRGIRARRIVIDETNTFDGTVIDQVIVPMANVAGEFERIASADDSNALFRVGTIDYTFREWYKKIQNARNLMHREYEAMQAMQGGDWTRYHQLMAENDNELKTASFSYTRFDYTDLIFKTVVDTEDGKRYEIHYPIPDHLTLDDVRKWDDRDSCYYVYSYPIAKKTLEEPLRNQTMDEELWRAEQRNVFIEASGNVYPDMLIRKISERPIYQAGEIPNYDLGKSKEERQNLEQWEFFPPVMLECGDPCVLGVDYARARDESAFVVFRLGELAPGKFDPFGKQLDDQKRPCYGKTPWNSVIWAESWPRMTHHQAADKVRELMKRYNIINTVGKDGAFGGVGIDGRGGGLAVRDELSKPSAPVLTNGQPDPSWTEPIKIYDPEDEAYMHYSAFEDHEKYWSGLRLLTPSNAENWEWTRYTKSAMEQDNLYIGYWQSPSTWAEERGIDPKSEDFLKWVVGYNGISKLKKQLVKLQIEFTSGGAIKVMMPGTRGTEDALKDLYSAFIYGWYMARQHLKLVKEEVEVPMVAPIAVQLGSANRRGLGQIGWSGYLR